MPTNCEQVLAGAFIRNCEHKPKQGVSKKWYGNWDDIDQVATQKANKGTCVTTLVLKAGKTLYAAEGGSKSKKAKHALAINDYGKGYIHTDELVVEYRGKDEAERIQELVLGARVFSINKMVDTGLNGETSFRIAGLESGMEIINDDFDSTANNGTTTLILATNEGEEEATGLKLYLDTDATTTQAWIDANV